MTAVSLTDSAGRQAQYAHGSGWDILFGSVKGTKLSPQCSQLLILLLFVKDEVCSGHFGGSAAKSVWATQGPAGDVTVTHYRGTPSLQAGQSTFYLSMP